MRQINSISIHCSATLQGNTITFDKYHRTHNKYNSIGYHYVILNGNVGNGYESLLDGSLEVGRSIKTNPAAVRGHNKGMIAICLVGDKKFTNNQFETLFNLIKHLKKKYKIKKEEIKPHYEYPTAYKTCPNFNSKLLSNAVYKFNTYLDYKTYKENY